MQTATVSPANSTVHTICNSPRRRSPVSFSSWISEFLYVPASLKAVKATRVRDAIGARCLDCERVWSVELPWHWRKSQLMHERHTGHRTEMFCLADAPAYLAIFTHDTHGHSNGALLYSDSDTVKLASWVPGLLEAGCGGQSVGRAYHRIVKGKGYLYQRIPADKVQELRAVMMQARFNA